jgi:hypothetical protein
MRKLSIFAVAMLFIIIFAACIEDDTPVQRIETPPSSAPAVAEPAAPVGQSNMARVGETLDRGGIQFTFDRIENYVDTGQFVIDTPEDGYEFIVLWFTVQNTTTEDYFVNMFYEDSYLDGFSITQEFLLFNIDGETIWGNIAAGRGSRGYVAYQVPHDWNEIEFQYSPIFAGQQSKLIFVAQPGDIQ